METTVTTRRRRASRWWLLLALLAPGCDSTLPPTTPTQPSSPGPLTRVILPAPAIPPFSATDPLVGRYTLEIEARSLRDGDGCHRFPDAMTRRTYTADIERVDGARAVVKLYDAVFLAGAHACVGTAFREVGYEPCHQFRLTGDSDELVADLTTPDEWKANEIWEVLSDGFGLQVRGQAAGRLHDGRIEMVGTGGLWYGDGLPATTFSACSSDDLRLTFTRR